MLKATSHSVIYIISLNRRQCVGVLTPSARIKLMLCELSQQSPEAKRMKLKSSSVLFGSALILEIINSCVVEFHSLVYETTVHLFLLFTQLVPIITGLFLSFKVEKYQSLNKLKKIRNWLSIYQLLDFTSGILLFIKFPVILLLFFVSNCWLISIVNIPHISPNTVIYLIRTVLFIIGCCALNLEIRHRIKSNNVRIF